MEMKLIKKRLLTKEIRITFHAEGKMHKRGYTRSDIISGIFSGIITKKQILKGKLRFLIEGKDTDGLPIVLIIGKDPQCSRTLAVVTVFPPIEDKFTRMIQ